MARAPNANLLSRRKIAHSNTGISKKKLWMYRQGRGQEFSKNQSTDDPQCAVDQESFNKLLPGHRLEPLAEQNHEKWRCHEGAGSIRKKTDPPGGGEILHRHGPSDMQPQNVEKCTTDALPEGTNKNEKDDVSGGSEQRFFVFAPGYQFKRAPDGKCISCRLQYGEPGRQESGATHRTDYKNNGQDFSAPDPGRGESQPCCRPDGSQWSCIGEEKKSPVWWTARTIQRRRQAE